MNVNWIRFQRRLKAVMNRGEFTSILFEILMSAVCMIAIGARA
jgi:hypothetical protein